MNIIRVLHVHIDITIPNNVNTHQFALCKLCIKIFGLESKSGHRTNDWVNLHLPNY